MPTTKRVRLVYLLPAGLLFLIGFIGWRAYFLGVGQHRQSHLGQRPTFVTTVKVQLRNVPLIIRSPGVVQSDHSVAIQAQVAGMLSKVLFREGDEVKSGQLLFVIEQAPYLAQVEAARGQVEQDKAKIAIDRANAKRMSRLIHLGYVSTQQSEDAQATVKQDEGILTADEAKLKEAKLQLSYTHIRAPISGKTGALSYKAGNLIQANGSPPLVTINEIQPILVQFTIPQSQVPTLTKYRHNNALSVAVIGSDGKPIATGGQLSFIDNSIDQSTGTLELKARFPNRKRLLWPGELVTVALTLAIQHHVIVVPALAIQPGQNGSYVYTIVNDKATIRKVNVTRVYKGLAIVSSGLESGEPVIVNVPTTLHQGALVTTVQFHKSAATSSAREQTQS